MLAQNPGYCSYQGELSVEPYPSRGMHKKLGSAQFLVHSRWGFQERRKKGMQNHASIWVVVPEEAIFAKESAPAVIREGVTEPG
jgi:hypothetical protein